MVLLFLSIFLPEPGACTCRLFKGLTPLWGRQIPYTMMKFGASYRICHSYLPIARLLHLKQDASMLLCKPGGIRAVQM